METTTSPLEGSDSDELYHLGNARRYMWLQPVLAAVLSAAVIYGLAGVIRVVWPDGLWQYLAIGVILATWSGLHHRFGIAVGAVVFTVALAIFGSLAIVAWVFSQSV